LFLGLHVCAVSGPNTKTVCLLVFAIVGIVVDMNVVIGLAFVGL
jgi:hypothetical protein